MCIFFSAVSPLACRASPRAADNTEGSRGEEGEVMWGVRKRPERAAATITHCVFPKAQLMPERSLSSFWPFIPHKGPRTRCPLCVCAFRQRTNVFLFFFPQRKTAVMFPCKGEEWENRRGGNCRRCRSSVTLFQC